VRWRFWLYDLLALLMLSRLLWWLLSLSGVVVAVAVVVPAVATTAVAVAVVL
jgi:hypothetical protein